MTDHIATVSSILKSRQEFSHGFDPSTRIFFNGSTVLQISLINFSNIAKQTFKIQSYNFLTVSLSDHYYRFFKNIEDGIYLISEKNRWVFLRWELYLNDFITYTCNIKNSSKSNNHSYCILQVVKRVLKTNVRVLHDMFGSINHRCIASALLSMTYI